MIKAENYYDILEVSINASMDEIKESYRKLLRLYENNDLAVYSILSEREIKETLENIKEAYSIIGDPYKRTLYNTKRNIESNFTTTATRPDENIAELELNREILLKNFALNYTVNSSFEQEIENKELFDGAYLKKIREYKNVNLLRMSQMTKISQSYITNIEEENFENLPANTYIRGFITQYAKFLKLPVEIVVNSYMKRVKDFREK